MASCGKFVEKSYDVMTQLISILDVCTDIIVCVEFYQKDRHIFFALSLSILLLALVAYSGAFASKFSSDYQMHLKLGLFVSVLPISPCLPFLMFHAADKPNGFISSWMEDHWCFDVIFNRSHTSENASRFKQFFESKVDKHLGFILESLVEGTICPVHL